MSKDDFIQATADVVARYKKIEGWTDVIAIKPFMDEIAQLVKEFQWSNTNSI